MLPCPFEVMGALDQFLDRRAEQQRLLVAAPALVDEGLDHQPAAHGRPTEQEAIIRPASMLWRKKYGYTPPDSNCLRKVAGLDWRIRRER